MKFLIENLGKISHAEFDLNGITLIVGNNNTGKSTTGKALFAAFNSLYNFDERIYQDRVDSCRRVLRNVLRLSVRGGFVDDSKTEFINDFLRRSKTDDEIKYAIESLARFRGVTVDVKQLMTEMEDARRPNDSEIRKRLIRDYFGAVFHDQYISMYNSRKGALVSLTLKGKTIRIMLRKESTSAKQDVEVEHPAYYVDTPDLLKNVNDHWADCQGSGLGASLVTAIRNGIMRQQSNHASAVGGIAADARLSDMLSGFSDILTNGFQYDETRNIVYKDSRFKEAFELDNLSEGLKSFGLLLSAIRYQALKPYDVLVLDEPEIHLHPEWQLRYAELIVLMQKAFGLTMLLTSHSPDFIQAMRLYAKKHGIFGNVNAYIAGIDSVGKSKFIEVDKDNWDKVFEKFVPPIDRLSKLREEVGD